MRHRGRFHMTIKRDGTQWVNGKLWPDRTPVPNGALIHVTPRPTGSGNDKGLSWDSIPSNQHVRVESTRAIYRSKDGQPDIAINAELAPQGDAFGLKLRAGLVVSFEENAKPEGVGRGGQRSDAIPNLNHKMGALGLSAVGR